MKGKCNAISIDKCHKTGVVFEDVIAVCEMVNCSSVQVQCTGSSPTVSVDKCDGVQVYIPAALSTDPNFQVKVTARITAHSIAVSPLFRLPEMQEQRCHSRGSVTPATCSTAVDSGAGSGLTVHSYAAGCR